MNSRINSLEITEYARQFLSEIGRADLFSDDNDGRYLIIPGLCDVHVHFREPGFLYKETIGTGTAAAAAGGYTAVCTMPNIDPVPDCPEGLAPELEAIKRDAAVRVYPFGAITEGERGERLSDMEGMVRDVCGFSDDGRGVMNEDIMREAMKKAHTLGKVISAHCEDISLLRGGYIHDGIYARQHGHKGICSESEYRMVERDIRLARETGCSYHVCHISTKESVRLIRRAKAEGVDVTCETAPHYLLLDESILCDDGRFKMNPPLRSAQDREELLRGIRDGTIDMIATDHAPHSAEEKSRGLEGSLMGVVGLETAFPVLHAGLVKSGVLTLSELVSLVCDNPRKRFGIPQENDFTVFDTEESYKIDPKRFRSKGRATPFEGAEVYARCLLTVCGGRVVYSVDDYK